MTDAERLAAIIADVESRGETEDWGSRAFLLRVLREARAPVAVWEQRIGVLQPEINRLTSRNIELVAANERAFEQNAEQQREIAQLREQLAQMTERAETWLRERDDALRERDVAANTPADAEATEFDFRRSLRNDGSAYLTCEQLPGFHYILGPEEEWMLVLCALAQFMTLPRSAAANNTPHDPGEAAFVEAQRLLPALSTVDYYAHEKMARAIEAAEARGAQQMWRQVLDITNLAESHYSVSWVANQIRALSDKARKQAELTYFGEHAPQ